MSLEYLDEGYELRYIINFKRIEPVKRNICVEFLDARFSHASNTIDYNDDVKDLRILFNIINDSYDKNKKIEISYIISMVPENRNHIKGSRDYETVMIDQIKKAYPNEDIQYWNSIY